MMARQTPQCLKLPPVRRKLPAGDGHLKAARCLWLTGNGFADRWALFWVCERQRSSCRFGRPLGFRCLGSESGAICDFAGRSQIGTRLRAMGAWFTGLAIRNSGWFCERNIHCHHVRFSGRALCTSQEETSSRWNSNCCTCWLLSWSIFIRWLT